MGQILHKGLRQALKASIGSVVEDIEQIDTLVSEMERYRGMIEGGFCIRRYETFLPETEVRYFIINGTPYAPPQDMPIPELLHLVIPRIHSYFYSVDIAINEQNQPRIIEI